MNRLAYILIVLMGVFSTKAQQAAVPASKYICPPCNNPCDEVEHTQPGVCEHCNMVLIKKSDSKTIAFYLQNGVEVLDFAGPMEVFSYAGYKVFTVSETKEPIKSQGILSVIPDYTIEDAPPAEILAFFGGNASSASQNPKVISWVKKQQDVQYHFSVCTGAFVLAEAGVLDGKTATTFHSALDNLESNYPKIDVRKNVRFVDNGNVITTAGISAGIDGALHMVAKLQGLNAAKRTAYYMEYDNWNIGDGLILTEENPYKKSISIADLEPFIGQYEFEGGTPVEIKLDSEGGDLYAKIKQLDHPIYHIEGDTFTNTVNEPIFFKRDVSNNIVGYTLSPNGKVFKKLN